jgi:hypothetical protein
MSRTKLRSYVASACLANAFFMGGLLQPAHAGSSENSAPSNLLEDSAPISSSQDCPYRAFFGVAEQRDESISESQSGTIRGLQNHPANQQRPFFYDHETGNDLSQINWNEIQDLEILDGTIDGHILHRILNSQFNEATSDASINEHDLDSLLNSQFEQREILLARCCV